MVDYDLNNNYSVGKKLCNAENILITYAESGLYSPHPLGLLDNYKLQCSQGMI